MKMTDEDDDHHDDDGGSGWNGNCGWDYNAVM